MGIEVHQIHNLVRTYQHALQPNASPKPAEPAGRQDDRVALEIADHGRRLNHVAAEIAMLEERWLELHTQLESLQAAAS